MPTKLPFSSALFIYGCVTAAALTSVPVLASGSAGIKDVETMSVVFTPGGSGYETIIGLIDKSQKSIRVGAYHFRSPAVTDALIRAHMRGVDVAVIMDAKNLKSAANEGPRAAAAGIRVYVDTSHKIHHNKFIVADGLWVETGSFNFHDEAEYRYAENLIVLKSKTLAREYEENWSLHQAHSQTLAPMHAFAQITVQ